MSYAFGQPLTLEEWAAMDEDDPGEIVNGRLEDEEDVGALHEFIVPWLLCSIVNWLGDRGWVFPSGVKYAIRHDLGRKPDLSVYLVRRKLPGYGLVTTPPDIAVEIVASTPRDKRRDRIEKMDDYAAFGIRFYWILDPMLQSLEIFELTAGRNARAACATEGTMRGVPGCEGLELDLDSLWAEISKFGSE